MGSTSPDIRTIEWQTESLSVVLVVDENGIVRFRSMVPAGSTQQPSHSLLFRHSDLPLTSLRVAGQGNTSIKTAKSLIGSYTSEKLKYRCHEICNEQEKDTLTVHSVEEDMKLLVSVYFVVFRGIPVLQSYVRATNASNVSSIPLLHLSSLTIGGMTTSSQKWYHEYSLMTATNGWFREAQWNKHAISDIGIDEDGICQLPDGHLGSQAVFSVGNHGSFSTGSHLPMGLLRRHDGADTWLWQIEHNGSWRWEIGDFKDSIYLSASGPTAYNHDCTIILEPGQSFITVPTSCCRVNAGLTEAFAAMTDYRRIIMRPHPDNENMPIIFNDYMNCLMGDPDEDKIKALLGPVSRSGAEYFVIDAGWYADDSNWWDDVGLWEPSDKRFPSGFKNLLDSIKNFGLIPGLWLEPEVVGVRSVVAQRLPNEAFFHEHGRRLVERGRYQLDYRHPEVTKWMNSVIRRLVVEYGAGYFKFDYNIEVVAGTCIGSDSAGAAHLQHQRAYLSWVRGLLDTYPGLVIENCSSGAQRMDYAMLSVHPLQSTSDQQDPVLYAAIAAAVPTAVVPEQSATWAYPQPGWDDETNALTVLNSLLGRIHLSGRLDELSEHQFKLVVDGMDVYKAIRRDLRQCHAIWPLGLPQWHDDWLCLGMRSTDFALIVVWRRGGPTSMKLPMKLGCLSGGDANVEILYPRKFTTGVFWHKESTCLEVELPDRVCARMFRVTAIV